VAHTVLRNTLYADDLRYLAEPALTHGVLRLPAGAGRVSLVSRDELAQAIAAATLAPRLDKRVYELTGQAAFPYADIAARIARVSGRPLAYEAVSADAYAGALSPEVCPPGMPTRRPAFSPASPPVVWRPSAMTSLRWWAIRPSPWTA
jgi:NAD(P)H dehydrogenase (quinone)